MSRTEERKILILRPTKETSVLLLHRVVLSVSGRNARSIEILVFVGVDPASPSF